MNKLQYKGNVLAFVVFAFIFLLYSRANAVILKDEVPPFNVPFTASIELSQNRFTQPTIIDLQINLTGTDNGDGAMFIYKPDGGKITDIGNNGEIHLTPGQSISWQSKYSVGYNELAAGKLNFVVKFPVIINKKQTVYRNYSLPIVVKKIDKKDFALIQVDFVRSHIAEEKGKNVSIKYIVKNTGVLTSDNIKLNIESPYYNGDIELGQLKPNELVEKDFSFAMPNTKVESKAKISYEFGTSNINKSFGIETKPINLGIPFMKLVIK